MQKHSQAKHQHLQQSILEINRTRINLAKNKHMVHQLVMF